MDFLIPIIAILAVAGASFVFGMLYGRLAEQYLVAKALAEYAKFGNASQNKVNDILSMLKRDYQVAYNDVRAEYERIKKAL